ncbi:MAG: NAD(P)H-hydrate dehydratase [Desulfurococcaceae archaeon]
MRTSSFKMKVLSVDEMRKIDNDAFNYGLNHLLLMEDAGSAIYSLVQREIGIQGKKFAIIAGVGNNGGDALVAARRIYSTGGLVKVFIIGDPSKYKDPAKTMYDLVVKIGIQVIIIEEAGKLDVLVDSLKESDVTIVGLIGIGLKGEVKGLYRDVIDLVNRYGKVIVSVDIPSGVDGNNGLIRGVAIRSHYTVTMGLPKIGNILYPGGYYCGKLYVSKLSYPPSLLELDEFKTELNTPVEIPERTRWGHKGTFGKLLGVSGAKYYYGAPYYSTYSFLKTGGGYARLAAPESIVPVLASKCSQIVYHPMDETDEGSLAITNLDKIMSIIEERGVDIVILGPGVSLNVETQELIRELTISIDKPVLIDGDGITAISKDPDLLKKRDSPAILTPHLVEYSRLVNTNVDNILDDPVGHLRKTSRELNSYIVLKGARSLISCPDGNVYINMTGNPGMAKAGMGDVLNGAIAGMYGIGLRDLCNATRMGVLVHGLAGDLVAKEIGEDGVTPDNVMEYLSLAVRILRENPGYVISNYMPKEI